MKGNAIRVIVIIGVVSIVGILFIQGYWIKQAYKLKEKQLDHSLQIALKEVAQVIARYKNNTLPGDNPVFQHSPEYFVVNINNEIDTLVLETYLQQTFDFHNIKLDYEFGIYNCNTDSMIYLKYVRQNNKKEKAIERHILPNCKKFVYYFGVFFPGKADFLLEEIDVWFYFSAILLFIIGFFGYSLLIILKQKRLSEVQKDFINNMTHEFKTPISTIAISADVLLMPEIIRKPQKLSNYAAIIKSENNRLLNLVEKVLQMANIEKNRNKLKLEAIDINEVIQQIVASFAVNLANKGRIECKFSAQQSNIKADKMHFTNLLYNLLDNALKYNNKTPYIIIHTEIKNRKLCISIIDNGIGIRKEFHKKIFEKFYRISTGNIHNVKGFGLGLNYVLKIVKQHGWDIKLESHEGKGSKFTILLPQYW